MSHGKHTSVFKVNSLLDKRETSLIFFLFFFDNGSSADNNFSNIIKGLSSKLLVSSEIVLRKSFSTQSPQEEALLMSQCTKATTKRRNASLAFDVTICAK